MLRFMSRIFLINFTLLSFSAFAQYPAPDTECPAPLWLSDSSRVYSSLDSNLQFELASVDSTGIVIHHTGYSVLFLNQHKQAGWVAYELTAEECNSLYKRKNRFIPEPNADEFSATNNDYSHSGFDRGHLAPAADMGWSEVSMAESFYFSNISPQLPAFNRGVWKRLETLVRDWSKQNSSILIATGPVFTSSDSSIGSGVTVPAYFYKVVIDYSWPDVKGIGFILPHSASSESLQSFAVSIDTVETLTGIDFFYQLPDEVEEALESNVCISAWNWGD